MDNRAQDILPPSPLGCEPGEVHPIFINLYVCPFCRGTTQGIAFNGVSTELYAVDDEGVLYRRFDPLEGCVFSGCRCGRGVWICTSDNFNIASIWDCLIEEEFENPEPKLLQ